MKVVRVIARLNVGGPAQHVTWLTAEFARAGHSAVLVCGSVSPGEQSMDQLTRAEQVQPVTIRELGRELSPRDLTVVWKLLRLFVRERPDVIHTHTAKAGAVGRAAALAYRIVAALPWNRWPRPLVVHTYHGHVFHSYFGRFRTWVFLMIERALARFATDRIVVISPRQLEEIHTEFRVGDRDQFAIVPLGFNLKPFLTDVALRRATRDALGLRTDTVAIGIVGRLTGVKDHGLFLTSAARLIKDAAPDDPPAQFFVVGDGHLRRDIEEQSARLGLTPHITFLGDRADMGALYAAFDIVALSSLNEGTPLSLLEAMASARAVVSTSVGGVPDLVGPLSPASDAGPGLAIHARGLLVHQRDAAVFASAMRYLSRRPAVRESLGAAGREFVQTHHSLSRLVGDILELYRRGHRNSGAVTDTPRRQSPSGNITGV